MMFALPRVVFRTYTIVRPTTSPNRLLAEDILESLRDGEGSREPLVGSGPASWYLSSEASSSAPEQTAHGLKVKYGRRMRLSCCPIKTRQNVMQHCINVVATGYGNLKIQNKHEQA